MVIPLCQILMQMPNTYRPTFLNYSYNIWIPTLLYGCTVDVKNLPVDAAVHSFWHKMPVTLAA